MKAVILAGGQGSRLRPLTEKIPKPMVRLLGIPIMEHIVHHLVASGVQEIISTLHYRPRTIQDHFVDGAEFDVRMRYTLEKQPLGTAGSVRLGKKYLDETFLVIAGDALVDFDFNAFLDFHRRKKAKVSLCLTRVLEPGEFGIVIADEEGRVQRFLEKPGPAEVFSDTINTGIYLIEPDVLNHVPVRRSFDFANDLFPALMEKDIPIYGYVAEGYWSDIGSLDQLRQAHWDFLDGKVSLPLGGTRIKEQVWVGKDVKIASAEDITAPCWIGDNVQLRKGARIGPYSVLDQNVEVDRFASVNRSIVMRNSFIGERSALRNVIVAPKNLIEAECELEDASVLGSACHLGRHVIVKSSVLVWPDKEIDSGSTITENLVWESLNRPSIFGSRGISGLANLHITPEYVAVIGKAFGTWAKKGRRVAVSRDGHPFSRLIKRAVISGLLAVGVDVDDLEDGPIPVTRYVTGYVRNLSGGMHVCMSSGHAEVTRIEMYDAAGIPLSRDARRKVEATFYRADFPKISIDAVGVLRYPGRVYDRYVDHLTDQIELPSLKRAADSLIYHAGDEISNRVLSSLLEHCGASALQLGVLADDLEEQQSRLAEMAKMNRRLGMFIFRNAEALLLVDETGRVIPPERTQELLTVAYMRSIPKGGKVFLPADHSAFLWEMAIELGHKVHVTRMEPAARLAEVNALANSKSEWQEFTHFYLNFDALAGALRLLEFLGKQGCSLHEFDASVPTSSRSGFVLACPWDQMGRVMREIAKLPESDLSAVPEGVRLTFDTGSVFVLPSADHPEMRVTVEAGMLAALGQLEEEAHQRLQRLVS